MSYRSSLARSQTTGQTFTPSTGDLCWVLHSAPVPHAFTKENTRCHSVEGSNLMLQDLNRMQLPKQPKQDHFHDLIIPFWQHLTPTQAQTAEHTTTEQNQARDTPQLVL